MLKHCVIIFCRLNQQNNESTPIQVRRHPTAYSRQARNRAGMKLLTWVAAALASPALAPNILTDTTTRFHLEMPRQPAGVYSILIFFKDVRPTLAYRIAPVPKPGWDTFVVGDLADLEATRSDKGTEAVAVGFTRFIAADEPLAFQFQVRNPYTMLGYRRTAMANIRVFHAPPHQPPALTSYDIPTLVIPCGASSSGFSLALVACALILVLH